MKRRTGLPPSLPLRRSLPLKTSDIPLEATSLFLFVGPSDSGKSYAASSFGLKSKEYGGDDDRPAYLMDCDGRVQALRGRPIVYDAYTNVEGAIGVLNRLNEIRETCVKHNRAPFHTLIGPDSFTSYCDFAIADSLEITEEANVGKTKKSGRRRGDLQMLTVQDYGYEDEAVRQLLWEALTDIKKYANVIVTAHEVTKYKVIPGAAEGAPSVRVEDGLRVLGRDKISAKMPTKFDEIYHFLAKETIVSQKAVRRQVVFQDELARTGYRQLASTTKYDITNKEFYPFWKELISR